MTPYPCPQCGYDGPHHWFAPNEFECGDCYTEFSRTERLPDVDFGPVFVEVRDEPTKPPYGTPEREALDLDVLRYAATFGQAAEDEAPLFIAAADEVERLREQMVIANEQIRQLCAESESQLAEIRANEAELLKRGIVIENLWARADELTAQLRKEKGANAENNDIIRRLAECACGNPAEHGPHHD